MKILGVLVFSLSALDNGKSGEKCKGRGAPIDCWLQNGGSTGNQQGAVQ